MPQTATPPQVGGVSARIIDLASHRKERRGARDQLLWRDAVQPQAALASEALADPELLDIHERFRRDLAAALAELRRMIETA